ITRECATACNARSKVSPSKLDVMRRNGRVLGAGRSMSCGKRLLEGQDPDYENSAPHEVKRLRLLEESG
ncbi:unnamed protein product, partial [Timema podura]|nr:unnamed protein product [Timema podura]